MAKASRDKGKRGEREFAQWLRERGVGARRGAQNRGGPESPDVVSDLPVHWEVKREEAGWAKAHAAFAQAGRDAGDMVPVVVHRQNRGRWIAVLSAEAALWLLQQAYPPPPSTGDTQDA